MFDIQLLSVIGRKTIYIYMLKDPSSAATINKQSQSCIMEREKNDDLNASLKKIKTGQEHVLNVLAGHSLIHRFV